MKMIVETIDLRVRLLIENLIEKMDCSKVTLNGMWLDKVCYYIEWRYKIEFHQCHIYGDCLYDWQITDNNSCVTIKLSNQMVERLFERYNNYLYEIKQNKEQSLLDKFWV